MLRVIFGLAGLLLLAGCVSSRDPQWQASITAAKHAARGERWVEAEAHWQQALAEAEWAGPENWRVASTLHSVARFYESRGRHEEAEQAYERTLVIQEKIGARGPGAARAVTDLAHLYHGRGRYGEAEPLYQRALTMTETVFGPTYQNVNRVRYLLARLHTQQGRYAEAAALYEQALAGNGSDLQVLRALAQVYESQGRYAEAEPLGRRLVTWAETAGSPRELARELRGLAALSHRMERPAEAIRIEARADEVFLEDSVEVIAVTRPEIRRTAKGTIEFEMTATVRYTLRSADAARLQVSAVRLSSAGCPSAGPSEGYAGRSVAITRGEETRVVPVMWRSKADALDTKGAGHGYLTVVAHLWSETPDHRPGRVRRYARAPHFCYALPVPGSSAG